MGRGKGRVMWAARAGAAAAAVGVVALAAIGGAIAATGRADHTPRRAADAVVAAHDAAARLDGVTSAQSAYGMLSGVVTELVALDAFGTEVPDGLAAYSVGAAATREQLSRAEIVDTLAALSSRLPGIRDDLRAGLVRLPAHAWAAFQPLDPDDRDRLLAQTLVLDPKPYVDALRTLEQRVQTANDDAAGARDQLARVEVPRGSPSKPERFAVGGALVLLAVGLAAAAMLVARRHRDLQRVADSDALTGVANRRRLDRDVATTSAGDGAIVGVLMIDLDHFKQLNDRAGHRAGDDALRKVARTIQACLRDGDVLYRYGGEEFCVLLPDAGGTDCAAIAERIRAAVEAIAVPGEEELPGGRQTVSIGIATNCDAHIGISDADAALYAAKRAGRNRIELARS